MRIIDRREIESDLYRAKYVCNLLKQSNLKPGDTFDWTDLHRRVDPTVVASWAEHGFIKLVSKRMVNSDNWQVLTPEEFVERLAKGKVKGSFHTRNLYEVISTDFDEFKEEYINDMIKELNSIAKELKKM